jgi:hypothetical protein
MPKEQINFPAPFEPRCTCSGNDGCTNCPPAIHGEAWPEPELNIGWGKANDYGPGHVQVSMLLPVGYLKHLAASLASADAAAPAGIAAFSPALSRDELNRLIRMARKARDEAFGRDE